jgi:serine/threonine protein phosphatase PrpC
MASGQGADVRFHCVGLTDVGRVREHNEDNFLVANLAAGKRGASGEALSGPVEQRGLALVVADGMGGAAAGEVASQMAVDMLHDEFKNADLGGTVRTEQNVIALLESAINKANEAIFRKGQESKDHQGMGTTLTAAVVLGDSLYLSQVGDSRGYVLRKGKLVQMTRDQSLIGQLIEEGTLTEEQAEKLGGKNIILQALGVEESLKIDSKRYDVLKGDTLLLNSDGLTGMVPDAKIEEILAGEPDLGKAAKKLIEAANAGGGKDNITCILARFEGDGLREPLSPLTDAERAGGSFHAPPPPRSKAGRNAVVATAAILGLVGAVLFWPKNKTVMIGVKPVDAQVSISEAVEGGGEGFKVDPQSCAAGQEATFKLPGGREYDVLVKAQGYVDGKRRISTKVDTAEIHESFELTRTPAKSLDVDPPLFKGKALGRVRVKFLPGENQLPADKPSLDAEVKAEPTKPEFGETFPAGKWRYRAEREGFEPVEKEFEVTADEVKVLRIEEMKERTGDVGVIGLPEGATISVTEEGEPLLDSPAVVGPGGAPVPLPLRATSVVIKAAREGFQFQDKPYRVEAGKAQVVDFSDTKAQVSFKGPANAQVALVPEGGSGSISFQIYTNGKSTKKQAPAGHYKATFTSPDGVESPPYTLAIAPGQVLLDLDAATGK